MPVSYTHLDVYKRQTIFFLVLTVFKFLSYFWTFSRQPVSQEMRLRLENGCLDD